MKRTLPFCVTQHPLCSACGSETSHDGDSFYCPDCLLDYGDGQDGNEGTYRDPDTEPCGAECDNYWHTNGDLGVFDCKTCALPKGHHRGRTGITCWTNCTPLSEDAS
jgi:hypothetical protein